MIMVNKGVNVYLVYVQHYERTGKFHFASLWQYQLTIIFVVTESAKYWSQCCGVNDEMRDIIQDVSYLEYHSIQGPIPPKSKQTKALAE